MPNPIAKLRMQLLDHCSCKVPFQPLICFLHLRSLHHNLSCIYSMEVLSISALAVVCLSLQGLDKFDLLPSLLCSLFKILCEAARLLQSGLMSLVPLDHTWTTNSSNDFLFSIIHLHNSLESANNSLNWKLHLCPSQTSSNPKEHATSPQWLKSIGHMLGSQW